MIQEECGEWGDFSEWGAWGVCWRQRDFAYGCVSSQVPVLNLTTTLAEGLVPFLRATKGLRESTDAQAQIRFVWSVCDCPVWVRPDRKYPLQGERRAFA